MAGRFGRASPSSVRDINSRAVIEERISQNRPYVLFEFRFGVVEGRSRDSGFPEEPCRRINANPSSGSSLRVPVNHAIRTQLVTYGSRCFDRYVSEKVDNGWHVMDHRLRPARLPLPDCGRSHADLLGNVNLIESKVQPTLANMVSDGPQLCRIAWSRREVGLQFKMATSQRNGGDARLRAGGQFTGLPGGHVLVRVRGSLRHHEVPDDSWADKRRQDVNRYELDRASWKSLMAASEAPVQR